MMVPQEIRITQEHRVLVLMYDDARYELSAEYLRVFSPSAQVRGHGRGQEKLQTGKRYVRIVTVDTVGNYALKITFDDGHDSGLYDWSYLRELAQKLPENWQNYLNRLRDANLDRDMEMPNHFKKMCSKH